VMLAGGVIGRHPLWSEQPVNMSEAAAARDRALVTRLLRRGERPDEPRRVRAGLVSHRAVTLTPIEAAIAARRAEVVNVLLPDVRPLDPATWNRLRCLAEQAGEQDTTVLLDRWQPPGATVQCGGIEKPW
jgi:hypothetical protein